MKMKCYLAAMFFMAGIVGTIAAPAPEIAEPLKTIRAVGPEGQGNDAAAIAWKKLAAGNAASILPILLAMDGANDYALNWLRSAVDTIAGRELGSGGKLPQADLRKFLLDTSHHPRARRLAFELIARMDVAASDQLLAGMLNDPSMELRHEAVQKLVTRAGVLLAEKNTNGAMPLLQQALSSARDVSQIEGIATNLAVLGHPVNLQKHFAFITEWKVIGPFDNSGGKGFDAVFPPEKNIDLAAEHQGKKGAVRWQAYATTNEYGVVDMNQPYGKLKEVAAYATAEFFSKDARAVELRLGGQNSWKVWLNGKLLFGRDEYHNDAQIDQYVMPAQLQAGRNVILVKVCQNDLVKDWTEDWNFQLRVTDSLGTPIVSAKPASSSGAKNIPAVQTQGNQ
jgi:hypothetical protein